MSTIPSRNSAPGARPVGALLDVVRSILSGELPEWLRRFAELVETVAPDVAELLAAVLAAG
jgi:hypothetical protein